MQRAIAAYVAGIAARNVGDMKRVFPSMPSDMQRNWDGLFKSVKDVEAHASDVVLAPGGADNGGATLSLVVTFPNPATKRPCTTTTQLRLHLARAGSSWRIASLDQVGDAATSAGCR